MLSSSVILDAAREAGFHFAGLARAERIDPGPLERWLAGGLGASMRWMSERTEERLDPGRLLPGARTVLALGCCVLTRAHAAPSPIALYAQGRDYHATLRDRIRVLRRLLAPQAPGVRDYAEVDTGPVLEKVWAQRAGLGFLGKNGMLIVPGHGSHVVLAVMLLDSEVDRYHSPQPDRCGRCVACLIACPSAAIVSPGIVDSRRCLSYQTIEEHGDFAEPLRPHARLAFGCDTCQLVCPWNPPGHACDDARFEPRPVSRCSLADLAGLSRERFVELTRGTAIARAHWEGLRRNAWIALGAARDPAMLQVAPLADDSDENVRAAARWALSRLPPP
ncbi:MAG: tRNA epoxyqueuosine(34) reductase QueG [Deltaproteobacteria bacterium]|nr:tRNA epoxyqueuosine(34) reductase QueG [Deltaproteobacteria bacterium]